MLNFGLPGRKSRCSGLDIELETKRPRSGEACNHHRIVLGSRSSAKKIGRDDHLTVVMKGERINQTHRKVDGTEVWRHTGEFLQAQLDSLLANATEAMDGKEFRAPNTYIVSVKRVKLLFSILTLPFSVFMRLFLRLFVSAEAYEDENGVNGWVVFNQRGIKHFIQSVKSPLSLLSRMIQKIPPKAYLEPGEIRREVNTRESSKRPESQGRPAIRHIGETYRIHLSQGLWQVRVHFGGASF
jgi:hypothetical protein